MPSALYAVVRRSGLTVLLVLLGAGGVSGQLAGLDRIQSGDSMRVHLRGGLPVDVGFERWQAGEMVLRVDGLDGRWFVDVDDVDQLEIYARRTNRESFRYGALVGAAGGLFAGAVVGLVLHTLGVIDDPDAPPAQVMTNTLSGAGIGVAAGILVGGLYAGRNPGYGWISIALPVH